jgi:entry exclusion lipoprotein TrbK
VHQWSSASRLREGQGDPAEVLARDVPCRAAAFNFPGSIAKGCIEQRDELPASPRLRLQRQTVFSTHDLQLGSAGIEQELKMNVAPLSCVVVAVALYGCAERDPVAQANACNAEAILHNLDKSQQFNYVEACMRSRHFEWDHSNKDCTVPFITDVASPSCFYDPTSLPNRARELVKKLR